MASISWFIFIEPISAAKTGGRAAGQQDGGDQDVELAQHRDADQLDREHLGPELGQQVGAQQGHDGADEEGGDRHDRDGVQARALASSPRLM
jgi:hypothetical protein